MWPNDWYAGVRLLKFPEDLRVYEHLIWLSRASVVIEESAHVYDTTIAALEGFTRFVQPGGFFVVEDGCVDVDELRLKPEWPRGVLPALSDWLATERGSAFTILEDLELYGLSCHPSGFLQRAQASP